MFEKAWLAERPFLFSLMHSLLKLSCIVNQSQQPAVPTTFKTEQVHVISSWTHSNSEFHYESQRLGPSDIYMYVCVFMALITTLVLCARSQDLVISVSVRKVHVVLSTAGLRAEKSRVVGHVKKPRCGEESKRPRALGRVETQAIGAPAHGSCPLSYPSAPPV